jgi:hypothetical protein
MSWNSVRDSLTGSNIDDPVRFSCNHTLQTIFQEWSASALKVFKAQLPLDDGSCTSTESSRFCSRKLFESHWETQRQSFLQLVQLVVLLLPDHDFSQCAANIDLPLEDMKRSLWEVNLIKCNFIWDAPLFSGPCVGDCPLHRSRVVTCRNAHGHARHDQCCIATSSSKPAETESCELYTYSWNTSDWSACSGSCGITLRDVSCMACGSTSPQAADSFCPQPKPLSQMECNVYYTWIASAWSKCLRFSQSRTLSCQDCRGRSVSTSFCVAGPVSNARPSTDQSCWSFRL